jgi:hypothetical protein
VKTVTSTEQNLAARRRGELARNRGSRRVSSASLERADGERYPVQCKSVRSARSSLRVSDADIRLAGPSLGWRAMKQDRPPVTGSVSPAACAEEWVRVSSTIPKCDDPAVAGTDERFEQTERDESR